MFTDEIIKRSLAEDIGTGDITTDTIIPDDAKGVARILAKEDLVVAGLGVAGGVFRTVDPTVDLQQTVNDGAVAPAGQEVFRATGQVRALLRAERVALNFLQRMCGIATLTRRFVEATKGTRTKILDTRKTIPLMRHLDKYAVKVGGGMNHRFGLFDAIMIKDNHLAACGGDVKEAIGRMKRKYERREIIFEVQRIDQIEEAILAGATHLLLDNMDNKEVADAVRMVRKRVKTEVSGGVSLDRVAELAKLGVDFISVGALTHSVKGADLSLQLTIR